MGGHTAVPVLQVRGEAPKFGIRFSKVTPRPRHKSRDWKFGLNGSLAAQVLVAQESERRRVCRDMHDDLAQKVALLEFQIEAMKQRMALQPQVLPELETLRGCVAALAEDVHRICFQLHPVILDNLGLVRGIEFLCEEQSRTSGVHLTFTHGPIPDRLPANVSLCLYRVVQEALQNLARHARTTEGGVVLHKMRAGLRVVIQDAGQGFDMKEAHGRPGLGLVFISERAKLLRGRCSISSAPGEGTQISVYVPLVPEKKPKSPNC